MQVTTFLDMCQKLVERAGISGNFTNTENQTGEFKRVVGWISAATTSIEGIFFNWNFLHNFHTFQTIVGVSDYPPPSDQNLWDWNTFQLVEQEKNLAFESWTRKKRDPNELQDGDPYLITILPNQTLRIYDTPTEVETVSVEYWSTPTILVSNSDVPKVPVQFRDVIVYLALKYYANYESADEAKIEGLESFTDRLTQLKSREAPANQASGNLNTGTRVEVSAGPIQGYTDENFF